MATRSAVWCLALLTACRTALTEAELQSLLAAPDGAAGSAAERLYLEVEIDSATLSGTFDAVLVVRRSPAAVRLQLLPDLGTPILDVAARAEQITALMHGEAAPRVWRGSAGDPPLSLAVLFGITLLEHHAPLVRERVLAASAGEPPLLRLRGAFPPATVEAAEVASGGVVARTLRYGRVRWRDEVRDGAVRVDAPGFALRARVLAREPADDVSDATFALTAGDGTRR